MFDRDKLRIAVKGIRDNQSEFSWTKGGVILIDDETIILNYVGTLAIFNRKTVKYYRDREEEVVFKKVLRICDDMQDFSVAMLPTAFDKFMKIMKNNK